MLGGGLRPVQSTDKTEIDRRNRHRRSISERYWDGQCEASGRPSPNSRTELKGRFAAPLARPSGKGAAFKALDDADADTTTRSEKLLLGLLALTAEFETEIKKEQQIEGMAQGRLAGQSLGASSW